MNIYKGFYADGKLEGLVAAEVNFTPAALRVTYRLPNQAVPVTLYWQVHRVVREKVPVADITRLHYGTFTGQTLEISDSTFWPAYEQYYFPAPGSALRQELTPQSSGKGLGIIYLVFISLVSLIPIIYFWILPAAADLAARQVPITYEQKLGKLLADQMVKPDKIDSVKTAHLNSFMRILKLNTGIQIKAVVLQHPLPNAFAVPGGTIVVHQAMLPLLNKPEELAALMGHEFSHIAHRHTLRTLIRSLSGYILISFIFGDISALSATILQNAHNLNSLVYSRAFEKEADTSGMEILKENKLNPAGMISLFRQLQKQSPEQVRENEYLSSHPPLSSRITHIQNLISRKTYPVKENDSLNFYFKKLKEPVRTTETYQE